MKRRFGKQDCVRESRSSKGISLQTEEISVQTEDCEMENVNVLDDGDVSDKSDKYCQVFICEDDDTPKPLRETFVCFRYAYHQKYVDAEIQTDISGSIDLVRASEEKKYKNKKCGTEPKTYSDVATGSNEPMVKDSDQRKTHKCFQGFTSIKCEEEFTDLTGVSFENFDFLLKQMEFPDKILISKENRLFFLLMKLKTGLTFAAMGGLFRIHRTTVSKIFFSCLKLLAARTSDLLFWPDQETVRATTPECFKPEFSHTRAIIDCTEFRIEIPASVENRVLCYSHYKHGFTFKVLFAITPSGFISFKSDAYGGRISDSHITVESGLIELLEHGDKVLADKGFPEFQSVIDASGKRILLVMPPFLKNKQEFTQEETEMTYGTAKVRIHVERIMQRLRTFRILDKIPRYLFPHIDEVIKMCCILVNLQPPIIAPLQSTKLEIENT